MPLYQYACPHGHEFEALVPMKDRNEPIACEGKVNQFSLDALASFAAEGGELPTTQVPCALKARRVEIAHSNPGGMLDHGIGANRDAAREGRWNPDRPITRGIRK